MIPVSTSPIPGAAMPGLPAVQSHGSRASAAISVLAPFNTAMPPYLAASPAAAAGRSCCTAAVVAHDNVAASPGCAGRDWRHRQQIQRIGIPDRGSVIGGEAREQFSRPLGLSQPRAKRDDIGFGQQRLEIPGITDRVRHQFRPRRRNQRGMHWIRRQADASVATHNRAG